MNLGWIATHRPCPCGKSSDAYAISERGGKCFSCGDRFENKMSNEDTGNYTYGYQDWRGVKADTFKKYNSAFKFDASGEAIALSFPYAIANGNSTGKTARKIRLIKEKKFFAQGDMKDASLFGTDIFPPASAEAVVITEGELDALSAYQMGHLPSVSVRGASSAFADCSANLDYLLSFKKIYICFDNDDAGKVAVSRVSALLGPKAYHVKLTGKDKDANDFLRRDASDEFINILFYSRRFIPDEIVSSYSEVNKILRDAKERPIISYPFPKLQEMTYGICQGITLITAQEGQGKTEIIRAIEAHALRTTDYNIGIIHLEESRRRSIQGLAGYELEQPVHLPDSTLSIEDVFHGYQKITRRDERVHIINHFDSDDPNSALELIRFLVVKCDCRLIFLDHITQLVSALEGDDERKKLDFFSTKLEQMTQELDFSCLLVSHVNDEGRTRGSRYISKVANVRIDLERDHLSSDPVERNKTKLIVSKNRDGARTGPSSVLYFDPSKFTIREWTEEDEFTAHI